MQSSQRGSAPHSMHRRARASPTRDASESRAIGWWVRFLLPFLLEVFLFVPAGFAAGQRCAHLRLHPTASSGVEARLLRNCALRLRTSQTRCCAQGRRLNSETFDSVMLVSAGTVNESEPTSPDATHERYVTTSTTLWSFGSTRIRRPRTAHRAFARTLPAGLFAAPRRHKRSVLRSTHAS